MRVMALDIGSKTIGVAVSDPLGLTAQGVTVIARHGGQRDLDAVQALVEEWAPERIVYGLPLHLDGRESESSRRARTLAERIAEITGLPIEPWDEAFTTREAERAMISGGLSRKKRKQRVDRIAAQLILQDWLEHRPQPDAEDGT